MSVWFASRTDGWKLRWRQRGADAAQRPSRKLEQWTGRRWTVVVSNEAGHRRCVRRTNRENQRERAAEADPRVQEVLARFPGAKVVEVRKLAPETPESEQGEDPAESSDGDDDPSNFERNG